MANSKTPSLFADFEPVEVKKKKIRAKKIAKIEQVAQVAENAAGFTDTADLLNRYRNIEQNKYVTQEFQSFGCHIAEALDDKAHTSLYIKLAKQIQRGLLERALSFVSDANADNKAKLFMWKLNQLKQESLAQIKKP